MSVLVLASYLACNWHLRKFVVGWASSIRVEINIRDFNSLNALK